MRRGGRLPRFFSLAAVFILEAGCIAPYKPRATYLLPPEDMDAFGPIPGAKVVLGVTFCGSSDKVDHFFPSRNGLLEEGILPAFVTLRSSDTAAYKVSYDSFRMAVGRRNYVPVSPKDAFDVAWQAKEPFIETKKILYYSALTIFTIVTAGLGSVIWVLPSPFQQPNSNSDPFGRDLAYKAFPSKAILRPGQSLGGMLYFHILQKPEKIHGQSSLTATLAKENPPSQSISGTLDFEFSATVQKERAMEWINGLLTP